MTDIVADIMQWLGADAVLTQAFYLVTALVVIFLPFMFSMIFAGIFIWAERRIAGRMQSRIGPNRVGFKFLNGFMQWIADAMKVLFKEDLIPSAADGLLYRLGPLLAVIGVMLGYAIVPWGGALIGADLDVGLLFVLSVTSLVVCGILMSGWASNSKWALFGGLRSAAQIVSYEIPHAMSLLVVVMLAGTLSIQGIIGEQGWLPFDWFAVHSPFALLAFGIYCISALAEGSRIPFDLPEAESELVAGYSTEYSGWRFLLFYLAELANVWIMAVLAVVCFLGGGNIPVLWLTDLPWYTTATPEVIWSVGYQSATFWVLTGFSFLAVMLKTVTVVFVISHLRWTLPRFRVDQMMDMCWKYLVPLTFLAMVAIMGWIWLLPMVDTAKTFADTATTGNIVSLLIRLATLMFVAYIGVWYVKRTIFALKNARDKLYIKYVI